MILAKAKTDCGKEYTFDEEFFCKSAESSELDYLKICVSDLLDLHRSRGFSKISSLKFENGKKYRHSVIYKFDTIEILKPTKHLSIDGLGLNNIVIPEGVEHLYCGRNNFKKLVLPKSLKEIRCDKGVKLDRKDLLIKRLTNSYIQYE